MLEENYVTPINIKTRGVQHMHKERWKLCYMVVHKVFSIESLQNEIQSLYICSHQVLDITLYANK